MRLTLSYTALYCKAQRVAPYIGHIQLKQITPAAINKAYSDMLSTGVSKATVYQYLSITCSSIRCLQWHSRRT